MDDVLRFVAEHSKGVLATIKRDGRPQLSNIVYGVVDDMVQISVTDDRVKTNNLRRDPRASLHVTSDDFWRYAVMEAEATFGPVAKARGDEATEALRTLYRTVQGEHPDWDEYDDAMIADHRLVLTLRPTHGYGAGL